MGSFTGHVFPGTVFILIGLWWTNCIFKWMYESTNKKPKFKSKVTFQVSEGFFKIIVTCVGIFGELITGLPSDWKSLNPHNKQHMIMYTFFTLNGLCDVINGCYDSPSTRSINRVWPAGTQRASLLLALSCQFLLFFFHLHGRSQLDIHLHTLLLISNAFAIIACVLEWLYPSQPLASLFKCLITLVMGTWFWQIAFILHNPLSNEIDWPTSGHVMMMNIVSLFMLHVLIVVCWLIAIGCFCYKRSKLNYKQFEKVPGDEQYVC